MIHSETKSLEVEKQSNSNIIVINIGKRLSKEVFENYKGGFSSKIGLEDIMKSRNYTNSLQPTAIALDLSLSQLLQDIERT
jgi:hypothetical protein